MGEPPESPFFGVGRLDAEGRAVYVGDTLCKILGRPRESLLGVGWAQLLPQGVARRIQKGWGELREGRPFRMHEAWIRPDDGRRVSYYAEWHPELDRDGRLHSIILTCWDAIALGDAQAQSERLEAEAAARLQELAQLYDRAPVGLCVLDRSLRFVRVNQLYADAVDSSPDELIGRSLLEAIPASSQALERIQQVLEAEQPLYDIEIRRPLPGDPSRERTFLLNLHPLWRDGEQAGLMAVLQDVSAMRGAEERATARLEELEILYANAPVGLCHMDPHLRIVHLNRLFAQLGPLPLEEQVGSPASQAISPAIAQQLLPQLREVLRSGISSDELELRGRPPGGEPREYSWVARTHALRAPDGEVSGIVTVLQDVTQLAARQRQTEVQRDRLQEAQQVARVGSWEWNVLDDEVWWSPELYEIFGERRSVAPSYTLFFEHVQPADRDRVRQQLEQTLENDQPYHVTFRIQGRDGGERLIFAAARLERTADGVAARLIGTVQDVTDLGLAARSP